MTVLDGFDFSVLDDPAYLEDAVREDIIAPILKSVGYQPTGQVRLQRSRPLKFPRYMTGSRGQPVRTIPDYTLYVGAKVVMVVDAKRPTESVTDPRHVGQARGYAVHPEIRAHHYGLCNGRELVIFSVEQWEPVAHFDLRQLAYNWRDIASALAPATLCPNLLREPLDRHEAWFRLIGTLVSPDTQPEEAANAAYRLSWYMTSVDAVQRAAIQAALQHLTDVQLIHVLSAAQKLFQQLDGTPAEAVGYLLKMNDGMAARITAMLEAGRLPGELIEVTIQLVEFLREESRPDVCELHDGCS